MTAPSANDLVIETRNRPRMQTARNMAHAHSVRVWRESPESIALQLRLKAQYVTVLLTFNEAKSIASALCRALPVSLGGDEFEVPK